MVTTIYIMLERTWYLLRMDLRLIEKSNESVSYLFFIEKKHFSFNYNGYMSLFDICHLFEIISKYLIPLFNVFSEYKLWVLKAGLNVSVS